MDLSEFGRFSDPSLLILASLAGGEKHGYAIMEDIEKMAGIRLGAGTLYGALSRLEQAGLIEALPADERRRPYRLTALGAASLRQVLTSLEKFVSVGLKRLTA
ncbi:MAG TPA: PadR family transcriptional regulator [Anaerolineales bacterium]